MWRYISKKLFNLNNNFASTNTGTSLCFQFASGEPIFLLKQKSVDGDFPVDGQRKDLSPFLGKGSPTASPTYFAFADYQLLLQTCFCSNHQDGYHKVLSANPYLDLVPNSLPKVLH